jgi:hypothetical protein
MAKFCFLLLLAVALVLVAGCASDPGSREFVPGQGWVPTKN